MIKAKIISSQEKVFADERFDAYEPLQQISVLRGERFFFQLVCAYEMTKDSPYRTRTLRLALKTEGTLASLATLRDVRHVPVQMPCHPDGMDDNYLRKTPGIYPDLLTPLHYHNGVSLFPGQLSSVWVEVDVPETLAAGNYDITFSLEYEGFEPAQCTLNVEVIDAKLPQEDISVTQWFHCDCLANYYRVEVWSERHWEIVENFVHTAVRNGINTLLTPVFTPPLDTAVGGERRTVQLVGVSKNAGVYSFDFSLLDRWIEMCDRQGVKNLEISHFFTQWGAKHAPKIKATVDGEYKQIFGWDTEAAGEEYKEFLRTFLRAFLDHMRARGDDKRCFFHISDEPSAKHLEDYKAAREIVADILEGYPIMDALSNYDFYSLGLVKNPIPGTNHIEPFLQNGVKDLWTYYCVSQWKDVSNRYVSMPLWRTRSIGMQIYKYRVVGFLQWGYNFYNNQLSCDEINPYAELSAEMAFPAGDAFSVYPASDGTALESVRLNSFFEALQDIKAMKLCESYYGHDAVVAALEEAFGKEITFATCAKSGEMMLRIRRKVNDMIKKAIAK